MLVNKNPLQLEDPHSQLASVFSCFLITYECHSIICGIMCLLLTSIPSRSADVPKYEIHNSVPMSTSDTVQMVSNGRSISASSM